MFSMRKSPILPIGVDIGHDSVKMLQLELHGTGLRVHASARRMLDAPTSRPTMSATPGADLISPAAAEAIREMLRAGEFCGRMAIAALPRQIVHVRNLRLPMMPLADLGSVVRFEASNVFPFKGDEAQVEYLPAGEVRQGAEVRQEVIAMAARHADVDRYVEQLHGTGLVPVSLDVEPCGIYRSIDRFVRRREDEQQVNALIDVGTKVSQVLVGKGREISFFKTIEIGGADFNGAVSRKLGITPWEARALRRRLWVDESGGRRDPVRHAVLDATRTTMENLAREIALCLRYHSVTFRGQRPSRVRLLGGEGGDPQLLGIVGAALSTSCEAGRPLFSVDCEAMHGFDRTHPSGEWSLALGMALKQTRNQFAPMDGTPRSGTPPSAPPMPVAEVVDQNAAMQPAAGAEDDVSRQDHFAAVRRASEVPEVANAGS